MGPTQRRLKEVLAIPEDERNAVEHYEVGILLQIQNNPKLDRDDLADFANLSRALNRVSEKMQEEMLFHYY